MVQNPNSSTMWKSPVNPKPRESKTGSNISEIRRRLWSLMGVEFVAVRRKWVLYKSVGVP